MGGLFDSDEIIPDDDYQEELGIDYHEIHPTDTKGSDYVGNSGPIEGFGETESEKEKAPLPTGRKVLVKKMPESFRKKFPKASTILFTNHDGTQILFIGE